MMSADSPCRSCSLRGWHCPLQPQEFHATILKTLLYAQSPLYVGFTFFRCLDDCHCGLLVLPLRCFLLSFGSFFFVFPRPAGELDFGSCCGPSFCERASDSYALELSSHYESSTSKTAVWILQCWNKHPEWAQRN